MEPKGVDVVTAQPEPRSPFAVYSSDRSPTPPPRTSDRQPSQAQKNVSPQRNKGPWNKKDNGGDWTQVRGRQGHKGGSPGGGGGSQPRQNDKGKNSPQGDKPSQSKYIPIPSGVCLVCKAAGKEFQHSFKDCDFDREIKMYLVGMAQEKKTPKGKGGKRSFSAPRPK